MILVQYRHNFESGTFIKRITGDGNQVTTNYDLPSSKGSSAEGYNEVLSIDTPGGDRGTIGRTFEHAFTITF
jgi:hypothetical protein